MRRVVLILLALAMFAPPMARASALYRCEDDGVIRTACCCPSAANHLAAPAGTEIRSACCCKVTQLKARESSLRAAASAPLGVAPVVVAVVLLDLHVPAPQVTSMAYIHAPRGPPESLFVRHCSLLL